MALNQRLQYDATGKRVRAYFNLHRKEWSIKAMQGPYKGRVIAHADELTLDVCRFVVSEAGRQRVIREGRKNVHAYVDGFLRATPTDTLGMQPLTYNPYQGPHFSVKGGTGQGLHGAEVVHLSRAGRAWAVGLRTLGPSFGGTWR